MLPITLLALATSPLTIEPLGFTFERAGDEVVVTAVQPGSAAEKAKLSTGDVITRVSLPMRVGLRRPFSKLTDEELVLTLTPPHFEQLVVTVKGKGTRVMARTDPPPADPFPEVLSPDELQRLTTNELARYYAALSAKRSSQRSAPSREVEPRFELSKQTAITIGGPPSKRFIAQLIATAATPEWVHYRGSLRYRCDASPMTRVEFRGTPPRTLSTGERQQHGGSIDAELPLWPTKDVFAACDSKRTELTAEVPLALSCTGAEPAPVTLTATLKVTCDEAARPGRRLDALRISPERLVVGDEGRVEARLWWDDLQPTPSKVRVVQVLESGKTEVLSELPLQKGETKTSVAVSTKSAGDVQLAVEVEFADRSVDRGPTQRVRVLSKEQAEAENARATKAAANFQAVQKRLQEKFPDACKAPAKAVEWLKQQPEVTYASVNGHDFSYVIDFIPVGVHCH